VNMVRRKLGVFANGRTSMRLTVQTGLVAAAVMAVLALAACGRSSEQAAPGGAAGKPAMPPAQVGVVAVQLHAVPVIAELPGRLEAVRTAQVRARVAGILQRRLFTEGADVKAGQPLVQIDSASYQAAMDSAQASQARAEANLAQATALADRYQPLQAAKAISPQEYLNAQVAQRQAAADVLSAKAAVQTARINLGYASVTSPIAGRIGRALVTEGALVGQGEVTPLAVVQQIHPLYVNFTQSANEVMKLRQALASGALKKAGEQAASIRIVTDDGREYPLPGKLLFSDLTVDATSGQVSLRAELPNPQGLLLPGMYVRVRLEQGQVDGGLLLPQQAVTRTSQADTVMVVGPDGMVTSRPIQVGGARGNQWVVLGGLKEGEQVMVDGFQKMMNPKAPVKAVPWQAPSNASAVVAPASAAASR
jgi:membrane fusion protein (multidrug efflux system)